MTLRSSVRAQRYVPVSLVVRALTVIFQPEVTSVKLELAYAFTVAEIIKELNNKVDFNLLK